MLRFIQDHRYTIRPPRPISLETALGVAVDPYDVNDPERMRAELLGVLARLLETLNGRGDVSNEQLLHILGVPGLSILTPDELAAWDGP